MKVLVSGMNVEGAHTEILEGDLFGVLRLALEKFFGPNYSMREGGENTPLESFTEVMELCDEDYAGNSDAPWIISIVNLETGEIIFRWDNR